MLVTTSMSRTSVTDIYVAVHEVLISNFEKQAKYTFPFYPYGLSLNAYWKTGTQLLQNALAHALLLDLNYTIKKYKKSINIYSPRL